MKVTTNCIGCMMRQIHGLVGRVSRSTAVRERLYRNILNNLAALSPDCPPPEYDRVMLQVIYGCCGSVDIYREEKDTCTRLAHTILDEMMPAIERLDDPFSALVKLAIGGNILDYGVNDALDLDEARTLIRQVLSLPLDMSHLQRLREALDAASSIFYVLDNCGESVMDSLLIARYRDKVSVGVRGGPVLNDVSRRELEPSGLGGLPVFDTGDFTPGVIEKYTASDFVEAMRSADVVVAKGQGNYETLDEYDRPIFFLFRAKCPVICRKLGGVPLFSLQIIAGGEAAAP